MEKKQQLVFRRGLLKAARRTRAWILTGGSHAGVMAMVGQTVRQASEDQHVVCLGVSSWGAVLGHEKMEKKGNGKVFQYSQRELTEAEDGEGEEGEGKERVALDPYHTHFVFVDDGSEATMRLSFIETEQARPVVVMPDSGGAAYDIYRFWTRGELPVVLPDGSNDGYVALCEELLPLIREVGSENTGANQVCPLSFFHIGSDAEG
ncbi:MAG: hypothetical protein SGPRY_014575, partial [Prymnesium sp.]